MIRCCTVIKVLWHRYILPVVSLLIGVVALYKGIKGGDVYTAPYQYAPLPRPFGRIVCFVVAAFAICALVISLR